MKLSVLDLVPVLGEAGPAEALQEALLLAQTAERLGYHRYWAAEHHDMDKLACASPEVLLAYIGAHTGRIRLGSGALLLPHYKPIKVAESFHLLASLFPGRIDLGIGRAPGGSAHVSIALSGNFLENVHNMPGALQALTDLLSYRFTVEGEPVAARPVPPAPPELWLLGTNQKSAAYAARFGTGYVFGQYMSEHDGIEFIRLYREQFTPSPLAAEPKVIVAVSVVCAETEEEARAAAREGAVAWKPGAAAPDGETKRPQFVGTPEQVSDALRKQQALYGIDEWIVITPIQDYTKRCRSYELLAQAVLGTE